MTTILHTGKNVLTNHTARFMSRTFFFSTFSRITILLTRRKRRKGGRERKDSKKFVRKRCRQWKKMHKTYFKMKRDTWTTVRRTCNTVTVRWNDEAVRYTMCIEYLISLYLTRMTNAKPKMQKRQFLTLNKWVERKETRLASFARVGRGELIHISCAIQKVFL